MPRRRAFDDQFGVRLEAKHGARSVGVLVDAPSGPVTAPPDDGGPSRRSGSPGEDRAAPGLPDGAAPGAKAGA
ncbi:hypothetical protein ACWD0A_06955 [Streptomyces sp. NPDC002867]